MTPQARAKADRIADRYAIRPDPQGFKVYDLSTGETVVIALAPQAGLSEADARHTAATLNRRSAAAAPRG